MDRHINSYNEVKTMTAPKPFEEALKAKDEEKNEIAIKLAMTLKKLSVQIEENGKGAE
jgi:hypothetical protein